MNIVIYHHTAIVPTSGGISRMAEVHRSFLTSAGHRVWFLAVKKVAVPTLEQQLYIEGDTCEEQKRSFINIMASRQVELMIYQDGIAPKNNHILKWAKEMDVRIVNVVHSSLRGIYGFDSHFTFSANLPSPLRKVLNKWVNVYFRQRYGHLYREMFDLSDRVVLLSDKFRNEITWFSGLQDLSKFQAITNPLPFSQPTVSSDGKKKRVIHVGSLTLIKRQDLLLRVWKRVEEQKSDWELVILGKGRKGDSLKRLAQQLKLKHVQFLGFQPPQPYYQDASIFCLTSSSESFGLVVVESMAFGCVPLAFDSYETASDIIDDGENGFLIKPFDVEEYARKLIWLMEHEEERQKMGMNAMQKSKVFDKEQIGRQWIELVEELAKEQNKKA